MGIPSTLNRWDDIPELSSSVDRIVACGIASSSLTLTQDQMMLQMYEIGMAYEIRWYMITISKWIATMPLLGECESCVTYLIRQSLSQPYLMEPGSFTSSICRTLAQKIFIRLSHPSHQGVFNTTSSFTQLKSRKPFACPPSRNQLTFTFSKCLFESVQRLFHSITKLKKGIVCGGFVRYSFSFLHTYLS